MDKLAVEQNVLGNTYKPAGETAAQQAANLAGFAYSFEELLQRVGARLDHAFSAADQSSGLLASANDHNLDAPSHEPAERSDHASQSEARDSRSDDAPQARERSADSQDDGPVRDTGNDGGRADNDPVARNDGGDTNNGAPRDNDRAGSQQRNDDGAQDGKSADASGNDNAGQSGENQSNAQNGNGGEQNGQIAQGVQQAAAIQAASLYASSGEAKASNQAQTNVDVAAAQQASRGSEAAQGLAAQAGAQTAQKSNNGAKANNHQSAAKTDAGANQNAQKAGGEGANLKSDTVQAQAQQLAKAIGPENRANVQVQVTTDQGQLSSKPTLIASNSSILTQEGAQNSQNGQQQQTGQQQQNTQGQTQQQLLAAQQQAAAQQAQQQTGPQASGPTSGGTGAGSVQSAGSGASHAGGPDTMNTNTQAANNGQQSQQTQQTRESQAQQQAQQAQRGNVPGSSVTDQISVKISKAIQAGNDRISIQLKPAELGRVDVRLEMTHDGRVMTVVTAEKQDTLDMLRRDSSELQKALAEAGLQTGDMEFNLKEQQQETAESEDGQIQQAANADDDGEDGDTLPEGEVVNAWESGIFMNGRLDMRA